jgi:Mg2+ and Co2+ transporter CorA
VEVIDGTAVPANGTAPAAPVCVMVGPSAPGLVIAAVIWVGADAAVAEHALASPHRRPLAYVQDHRISVVALATVEASASQEVEDFAGQEVHLHVGSHGLVVVCPQSLRPALGEVVSEVRGSAENGLLAVLLALADRATAAIQDLSEEADQLDQGRIGLTSGNLRRTIAALRRRLFALQQLWAAHSLMCGSDGTLAEALHEAAEQRRLRQAGGIFEASSAAAARAYALLGDTLTRQATLINERLTLVTVIFLPLTVISSFFGMNFGWMVDHIGSAASFVLLGVVLPLVVAAVTWVGARMLSGG